VNGEGARSRTRMIGRMKHAYNMRDRDIVINRTPASCKAQHASEVHRPDPIPHDTRRPIIRQVPRISWDLYVLCADRTREVEEPLYEAISGDPNGKARQELECRVPFHKCNPRMPGTKPAAHPYARPRAFRLLRAQTRPLDGHNVCAFGCTTSIRRAEAA